MKTIEVCEFCNRGEEAGILYIRGNFDEQKIKHHWICLVEDQDKKIFSLNQELERAYGIGALAMAHYYHREYASDHFKNDHAQRAQRAEHIEWAKQNFKPELSED